MSLERTRPRQSRLRQLADKIPYLGKKTVEQKQEEDIDRLTDLMVGQITTQILEHGFTMELHQETIWRGTAIRENPDGDVVQVEKLDPVSIVRDYAVMLGKLKNGNQRYGVTLRINPGKNKNQLEFMTHDEKETAPEKTGMRYGEFARERYFLTDRVTQQKTPQDEEHQNYHKDSRPGVMHEKMSYEEILGFVHEILSAQWDHTATEAAFQEEVENLANEQYPAKIRNIFWNRDSRNMWKDQLLGE